MIVIGQIVKAQGIKGEVKVFPITCDINRFSKLQQVIVGDATFAVLSRRIQNDFVVLKLDGVNDRNNAERLCGQYLQVKRENAVKLQKGHYFITDILNSKLFLDDEYFGVVKEINQYGAADVYVIQTDDGKTVSFPLLKELILRFDIERKEIYLKKRRFYEVAVL